ncbi:MAG TPA: hypothetical protein DCE23_04095 [Firmicutes bacterium]|nr:hypothetical protein [Bacillota bacterium]
MSKADVMFKKLRYEKEEHHYHCGNTIDYENLENGTAIDFMLESKRVKVWHITVSMQELQAINLKCKELGWIE